MKKTNTTIPNGWSKEKFGKHIKLEYGFNLPDRNRQSGGFPVFGSNGIVASHNQSMVKGPGIIVGRKGTIGVPVWSEKDFWPIDTTYYVVIDENMSLRWLYYKLAFLELKKLNTASGVPGLNREEVYKLEILLPPKPEQEKIAEILSAVDEDIEKTEEVIRETERMKRGLMRELLTKGIGHTKFKKTKLGEIPDKWDIQPLDKVAREFIGGGTPSRSVSRYWNGEIPWLTVKDFPQNFYVQGSSEYITEEGLKNSASNIVPKDSVITAIRVGLGRTFLNTIPLAINQDLRGIVPNKDIATSEFLTWFLISIGDQISADGSGSTVKGITLDKLKNYLIPIPDKTEQEKIVEILSGVDERISVNKQLKEQRVQLKKGLMADLLTGRVRTI